MGKEEKERLYYALRDMLLQMDLGHQIIDGVDAELRMMFENAGIQTFEIRHVGNQYNIIAYMDAYDKWKARDFFMNLFRCLSYGASGLFAKQERDPGVRYLFASFIRQDFGFFCEIDIVPAE